MEEGHFDTEGNYHWKNEKEIRDNWLENIEWVNVSRPILELYLHGIIIRIYCDSQHYFGTFFKLNFHYLLL